jgi:hypothetical protein
MADATRREQVMAAIVARLETVLASSGFNTDLGRNVFRWRTTALGPNEVPGCIVRDVSRRVTYEYSDSGRDYEMTVEVIGQAEPGERADALLNLVVDDIYKAMLEGDRTLSGVVNDIVPDSDEKVFDQQERRIGGVLVRFNVRYRNF